jgi:hypothetical protein
VLILISEYTEAKKKNSVHFKNGGDRKSDLFELLVHQHGRDVFFGIDQPCVD